MRSFLNKIHLKIFGWYQEGNKYYIECPTHGVTEAYSHGYDTITCLKCLKEWLKEGEKK